LFKDRTFTWVLITTVCFFALISLIFLPKAFSGEVVYSPEVLSIGPLAVRWYGLLISSSILLCYFIGRRQAFKERVSEDDLLNAVFIGIILGVIGARLYYVIFNFSFFSDDPISILKIWTGGLAIHGGILGAVVSTFLYTRYKKNCTLKFFQAMDLFTFVLPLSQGIGRWGNFMNHEAYGTPTDFFLKMYIPLENRMPGLESFSFFHPTFLYESVCDVAIFLFLFYYIRNRRKVFGEVTSLYLMLYSIARMFIELLRTDSLMIGNFRTAVVTSIIMFFVGLVQYIYLLKKRGAKI